VIEESISSLERRAEEESNYAKRLKSRFGEKTYVTLLKKYLLEVFTPSELDFLGACDSFHYIILSDKLQSELIRGLKSMKDFLAEGEKQHLMTQVDDFTQTLNTIYNEGSKTGISPVLIDFALKRWLKTQMPTKSSIAIHKKVNLSLQFFSKRELRKSTSKRNLIRFTERAVPMTASLSNIKLEDFNSFIEEGNFFCDVCKIFAGYYIEPVKIESQEFDSKDINEKIRSTQDLIKENAVKRLEKFLGDVSDLSVKEIRHNTNEIVRYINSGEAKLRALRTQLSKLKDLSGIEERVNIPGIFRYFDPNLTNKIQGNMERSVIGLGDNLSGAPESFLSRGLLGRKTDFESVINWFIEKYDSIFIPTIVELIFEDIVRIFPESENSSIEEARWIGLLARRDKPPAVFFVPEIERELSREEILVRDCLDSVSVMVYDIRGSSLMGEKLMDAEMENRIRKEFQEELIKAVDDSGGFFVKDTGDGGIVLFSEESSDLYFSKLSLSDGKSEGKKEKLEEEKFNLKASSDSAIRAIQCARRMISYSDGFVRKNLKRYKEWFKEFDEKGIDFGGITYEHLPPEYRKIFQIGIGIASGKPGEDIYLGRNVLNRLDLTGSLVRRANMYSTVHHPDRSVILIGASTMFSFLLNAGSFKTANAEEKIEKSSYLSLQKKLIEEVVLWMKGLSGNYLVNEHKVALKRIDYLLDGEADLNPVEVPEESVGVKKGARFFDSKIKEQRVLYEVIPR
jgi:class 3 adenylate cyclase